MKKTALEYETDYADETQAVGNDVFETPLASEEKDDDKPQLLIGVLLIICMVSGVLAALIPPFAVFLFAALSYSSLLGFFSEEMEKIHGKIERKLRERFLRK